MAARLTLRPDITASPRPLRSRAQKPKRGATIREMDSEVGSGITRIFTDSKKNVFRQEIRPKHLPGISRPQKRDQTEIYNEKHFELSPEF